MNYTSNQEKAVKAGLLLQPLTAMQRDYLHNDRHRFFVVTAGRRSRKTLIGQYKLFRSALMNSGKRYFAGAPTQTQAEKIFWNSLQEKAKFLGVLQAKSDSEHWIKLHNGSEIHVVGLDKPERVEGTPWHGCHITEMPNVKARAWAENIRPVLSDTGGFAILDGTPDFRFPHYVELAEYAAGGQVGEAQEGLGLIQTNPLDPEWVLYTWHSADVLDKTEIEAARRQLDERVFKQEYEGSFVTVGLSAYYNLSHENYSDEVFHPERETVLCFDFNVNPMSCVVNQKIGEDKWVFVHEFYHHNSSTEKTCEAIDIWLHENKFEGLLRVTGDATGSNRKTSATLTDWQIIEAKFKNARGYEKRVRRTKSVKDRVNTQNAAFKTADGTIKQYINVKACPNLHKDYIKRQWKDNGVELDDAGGSVGHLSDAGSYFSMNWYPLGEKVSTLWL